MDTERRYFFRLAVLLVALLTFCVSCDNPSVSTHPPISLTATLASTQGKFVQALNIWESHHIADYQVTVDVFSSYAAPACETKAVLSVRNGILDNVKAIVTPQPAILPNGQTIFNPDCADYSKYVIDTQFKSIGGLLQSPFHTEVYLFEFNEEYGYMTHLVVVGGESTRDVRYSDFIQR
jgi:hypothetical protein